MPHMKRANAMVVHPRVSRRNWDQARRIASSGASDRNLTDQAREILGGPLDPGKYLFTHCTIVASVDTEVVPDVKLGKVRLGSTTIDRRYADYYIKPACNAYVNNNGDSWSRPVLLASYPTFINGHNFLEHVQVEEKSKGRLIDAVARDIGDSVYIDLLVATDRKHSQLIRRIESGELSTLSMGCTTDFTICTKCGHYAVDETDLCKHVAHEKLNTFLDDQGQKRVIAELCGHVDHNENPDAPGGVRFIEASWVGTPAFPGAVMHEMLSAKDTGVPESEIRRMLAKPHSAWSQDAISKAASTHYVQAFEFGAGMGDEGEEETPEAPVDPFKDLEDSVHSLLMERVKTRIKNDMAGGTPGGTTAPTTSPNDTLIKEGFRHPARTARSVVADAGKLTARYRKQAARRYKTAMQTLVSSASSDISLVEGVARINASYQVSVPPDVYRAALAAGSVTSHSTRRSYIRALRKAAGREFNHAELRVVVRVGTLLSRWESINNPNTTPSRSS